MKALFIPETNFPRPNASAFGCILKDAFFLEILNSTWVTFKADSTRATHVIVWKVTIIWTEQSDQPEFMHGMYFLPFNSYLQLRETLLNTIYVVEIMQPLQKFLL